MHLTDEILQLLTKTNERFAEAIRSENYYAGLKIDEQFHKIIVNTAKNSYIDGLLDSLQAHVRRQYFHNSIVLTEKSIEDHWKIIELMKNGHTAELAKVMKENWLRNIHKF